MSTTKLVVLITSQTEDALRVGDAWQQAGAPGVTFLEGFGLRHLQKTQRHAEVLPGMMSMLDILRQNQEASMVVLSLLHDDTLVQPLLDAAQSILGDMHTPNAGVVFVIDVQQAIGIRIEPRGTPSY
ncbi:MAG: hypothetical protein JNJ61_17250 [Anaerolineae bacterium]|nr:hypothetical protein [Anaerolineae bacterium]